MREAVEHALRTEVVIHLIGGTDADTETTVEEVQAATDSELHRVACTPDTTAEAIPSTRVPEGTLVYYEQFGDLPSEVQVTAAQCIKCHFELGIPVIVRSSEAARYDLIDGNSDLRGRVRSIELDTTTPADNGNDSNNENGNENP